MYNYGKMEAYVDKNNLNSAIDSLAEIINPTQKEICNER